MSEDIIEGEDVTSLVQIAGLVRFSYPTKNGADGFKAKYEDRDHQLRSLFAPERMEERLKLFEKVCLHALRNQTRKNFKVGVLIGSDMPNRYRARLEAMIAEVPEVEIISLPILPYKMAIRQAFEQLFDEDKPFRMSFRLDDDDAVAIDYIEKINGFLPQLVPLTSGLDPVCLAFNAGLTLVGQKAQREIVSKNFNTPRSVGVAVVAPAGWSHNVFVAIHPKLQLRMRTVFDPTEIMMLRIFHDSNDSSEVLQGPSKRHTPAQLRSILQERFALDIDDVLTL